MIDMFLQSDHVNERDYKFKKAEKAHLFPTAYHMLEVAVATRAKPSELPCPVGVPRPILLITSIEIGKVVHLGVELEVELFADVCAVFVHPR